jgi:hypothetical protein
MGSGANCRHERRKQRRKNAASNGISNGGGSLPIFVLVFVNGRWQITVRCPAVPTQGKTVEGHIEGKTRTSNYDYAAAEAVALVTIPQ